MSSPEFECKVIPFQFHKAFFHDKFFSDCWDTSNWSSSSSPKDKTAPVSLGETTTATRTTTTEIAESRKYQVVLDIQLFKSSEVSVTAAATIGTSASNSDTPAAPCTITIEGKHEERSEPVQGYIARQFIRKFTFPSAFVDSTNFSAIECHLSSDGVLLISVPLNEQQNTEETNGAKQLQTELKLKEKDCGAYGKYYHNVWSKMKHCNAKFHVLPTYELIPFWERPVTSEGFRKQLGIHSDHENYKVLFDVSQFMKPGELNVTCTNHVINIEGKHLEKEDSHGFISRQFMCFYDLPKSVDSKDISCILAPNGILEINAVKAIKKGSEDVVDRKVDISSTAAPATTFSSSSTTSSNRPSSGGRRNSVK